MFETFIVVVIVLIVILVIAVVLMNEGDNRVRDRVLELGFTPDKTFVSTWDRSFIALNFETMKIALGRKEASTISDFSQIIQVDLLRDNATVTSTDKGAVAARVVVGGVLLGGVGAVVGAVTAKTKSLNKLKSVSLRVITEKGSGVITFLDLKNTDPTGRDQLIQMMSEKAEQFYGLVLNAMRQASRSISNVADVAPSRPQVQSSAVPAIDRAGAGIVGELEKLWQLKERGAITLDEYEKAKATVLPRGDR